MPTFIDTFRHRGVISFQGMRDTAVSMLPVGQTIRNKLFNDLERGKGILDDDDHLNMYLYSFGKMHKAKLDTAYDNLPNTFNVFDDQVEIYDWGCGQGLATICLLDHLHKKGITPDISRICLVDPSTAAVERAAQVISCYDSSCVIQPITKEFDKLKVDDFKRSNSRRIHLFSNILDVDAYDLSRFINLFQQLFGGDNYFIIVGPYYSNNKRVDEFVAAIVPDAVYGNLNLGTGAWQDDWTISMRIFFKRFDRIETVQDIRKRIEDFHKEDQFFAGYILDAVEEEYCSSTFNEEAEILYKSLSIFDVKSNVPLDYNQEADPKLAVLANIISRGLPTKAPVLLEETFSDVFHISEKPEKDSLLKYPSTHAINALSIFEALHIIDPRFKTEFYNADMLESSFEKGFIDGFLKNSSSEYLIQLFEPQRPLSTIVDIRDKSFSRDQRVDFSLEIPYKEGQTGFIVEMDGRRYHSNIFQKLNDEFRDRNTLRQGWDTYRIETLRDMSFLQNWEEETSFNRYITNVKRNYGKTIRESWRDTLQIVLSPIAVARVERMLVEAMMAGALNISNKKWSIAVVERDVPCAGLAVTDIKEKYKKICELAGSYEELPEIDLCIISTEEFKDSPLHIGYKVRTEIPETHFDLCMDVSVLLRDKIDALPLPIDTDVLYLIRSSHYKKRNRTICAAGNIQYPPFVTKDSTGIYNSISNRELTLTYFLKDIFRKPSFRPGQLPILSRALSDKTTIGLLPTGGGKSLTYQLSCMLQPGVSIIVDPLVSLMEDQVRGLKGIRIDACNCVHSGMEGKEKSRRLNQLQNGNVLFMLLSPERFMMENFRYSLLTMTEKNHVYFSYGIIDEVHCVSEWGHDFRTSYLHLGRNMINFMHTKSNRPLSIIGLTATASFDVLADVERELTLGGNLVLDSETVVRPESDSRPELTYRIIEVNSNFDTLRDPNFPYLLNIQGDLELRYVVAEAKRKKLISLLKEIPEDICIINDNENDISKKAHISSFSTTDFYNPSQDQLYHNAGIVFCPHAHGLFGVVDNIRGTQPGVSTTLRAEVPDLKIGTFIGGDKPTGDMKLFNDDCQNIMIATKAFGMGIDKPNVRYTIHINHPSSIESYVQEAGRGGRDKMHAISYVLYDPTEYLYLTYDKLNDIRYYMGEDNDPVWLEKYHNKFILASDIPDLCRHNNVPDEIANRLIEIIRKYGFLENVDKIINLWFHNNSFRGLFKEKVILAELTHRLLNAKPTRLLEVQEKLRDATGITDVCLKVISNFNRLIVYSEDDNSKKYGYLNLDYLNSPNWHVDFDSILCTRIIQSLKDILRTYESYSANDLLRPIDGYSNTEEGIYNAIANSDEDGNSCITISWENQINQDFEGFERRIRQEIRNISQEKGWNDLDEDRTRKPFNLSKINSFEDLVSRISSCSGDDKWLRHHADELTYRRLKKIFCEKRDKNDTDKAIYRLCCIGLVEDVTIDYLSHTYELRMHKHTDEEYKQFMLDFFRKYYSLEQAQQKVAKINSQKGKTYLDKCLGYITGFVYESLEKKRYRAIEDMSIACEDSIVEKIATGSDNWLKEFIHLYFNSKYARAGYEVNGHGYSLMEDTDTEGKDGFDVVKKYIEVIDPAIDNSGSEVDNVKHLYGATLLCLRAHPDNAALQLLRSYCVAFLGTGNNETLKTNAFNGYLNGFISMYETDKAKVWDYIDIFNNYLQPKVHKDDTFIMDNLIVHGKEYVSLFIHNKKLNDITNKYLS